MTESPMLRARMYVGGELRDEQWLDVSDPGHEEATDELLRRHLDLAERSTAAGLSWLLEMYDPGLPAGLRYLRLGTDATRMANPTAWTVPEQMTREIDMRYAMTEEDQ
jgi:hypothetical protein